MGFALLTTELISFATVVTYDLSGHGMSQSCDLSIDHLIMEANLVLRYVKSRYPEKTIIIYGHSLGGAIACKMNHDGVIGLVTGDVLEKKTINHIPQMLIMLRSRP
jgi:alpha-beta hydrolase superfamily lysophospholipase